MERTCENCGFYFDGNKECRINPKHFAPNGFRMNEDERSVSVEKVFVFPTMELTDFCGAHATKEEVEIRKEHSMIRMKIELRDMKKIM